MIIRIYAARGVDPRNDKGLTQADFDAAHGDFARALAQLAGGYTRFTGDGGWVDAAGCLVGEPSFIYETACDNVEGVRGLVVALRDRLRQDCVLMVCIAASVDFV